MIINADNNGKIIITAQMRNSIFINSDDRIIIKTQMIKKEALDKNSDDKKVIIGIIV